MQMILDATAANRHMWTTKNPENVVFMDREPGLRIKPDILADFRYLPFQEGVFSFVVFDPPHLIQSSTELRSKWLHSDPFEGRSAFFEKGSYPRKTYGSWWGFFKSGQEMRENIMLATNEIHRVTMSDGLLHFKWNNSMSKAMGVIGSFGRNWLELYRTDRQTGTHVSDSRTFWVLFQKRNIKDAFKGEWIKIDIDEPTEIEIPEDSPKKPRKRRRKPTHKMTDFFPKLREG